MDNIQPFFILANPRSGSSLLRIICTSHPQIIIPPECGFLEWWFEKYKGWNVIDSQSETSIQEYCKDLASSKKFETYHFDFKLFKKLIAEELPKNYSELSALVYLTYGQIKDKNIEVWGDKNNYYITKTALINQLYPQAKYIHLIRDGRDVATSYQAIKELKTTSAYAPKLPDSIKEIAEEWNLNNEMLQNFYATISEESVLKIRYEDLINHLEDECKRISSFLNLPFNAEMLNYYKLNQSQSLEPKETLDWKMKTLEKPDTHNIGKYKKILSKDEIKSFNKIASSTLKAFNYEE